MDEREVDAVVKLGDLITIESSSKQLDGDLFWLLNLDMVEQQTGNIIEYNYVNKNQLNGSIIQFDSDTLLYSKLRPNLNKVVLPLKDGFATSEMLPIKVDSTQLSKEYLAFYLRSDSFVTWAVSKTAGAKMPRLGTKELLSKYIPLPTLAEQQRISQQFSKLDALISLRKQQLSKLDELVKSRFIELFENGEYEKVTVHSVLNTAFWLMPATPEFIADGEVPYITSKNIKNRMIDFDNVKYISKEAYKSISSNRPTQKGDILVSMIGTLGQTAVIQDDREFYGQNLYLLRLNNTVVNTTYFCEFFNSDTAQYELQGKRNQSTQAYLKANHVEDLILSFPPLELQEQFATFVEQVDKSKSEIQKSLEKLETLKKALMQKYFG